MEILESATASVDTPNHEMATPTKISDVSIHLSDLRNY